MMPGRWRYLAILNAGIGTVQHAHGSVLSSGRQWVTATLANDAHLDHSDSRPTNAAAVARYSVSPRLSWP